MKLTASDTAALFDVDESTVYRWIEERGLPAERIAGRLASLVAGCRADPLLRKQHETPSQTKLGRQERRRNVAGAFIIAEGRPVEPATRYVVIDDVLTTGATLHACALTLRKAGATLVDAAALAHG